MEAGRREKMGVDCVRMWYMGVGRSPKTRKNNRRGAPLRHPRTTNPNKDTNEFHPPIPHCHLASHEATTHRLFPSTLPPPFPFPPPSP